MLYAVIGIGLFLVILERIIPDQKLPEAKGWWLRVSLINAFQLLIVFLGAYTWDHWFGETHLFHLSAKLSPLAGALISYVVITFVFYWWHRWRHDVNFLWLSCHQLHHSASRIETITSFYKHPLEIVLDSLIICVVNHLLLGVGLEAAGLVLLFTACAEYFYHMNIKTPHWIGYVIQRPEMHRIHHERGKHYSNFSDLPVWDMMFGTFVNPKTCESPCGFYPERETQFKNMLLFKNVNRPYKQNFSLSRLLAGLSAAAVIGIGLLQSLGYMAGNQAVKGLGFASASSPLPIVFTNVKGIETFALYYELKVITTNNDTLHFELSPALYKKLQGPYNRRNIYGAAFAYGPLMPEEQKKAVLHYAFFGKDGIAKEFGIRGPIRAVEVITRSRTKDDNRIWKYLITA